MDWTTVLGIIVGNAALYLPIFFWMRSEANADRRELQGECKQIRRDLIDCVRAIETEMKDFHTRLCSIEERRK